MRRTALACLVVAVIAGGAGYLLHRRLSPRPPPLEVIRIDRPLPRSARIDIEDPGALAMAADGRALVAAVRHGSRKALLLQYLDKFDATEIPGTSGASAPFLSPDGATVGFVAADGSLRSVSSSGDTLTPLLSASVHSRGATFGPDGQPIVGQLDGGLLRKTSAGSWTALTLPADSERAHAWPHWIPGADAAVFTIDYPAPKSSAIGVVRLASPGSHVVVGPGQRAWFIDATHLIVARDDGLFVVGLGSGKAGRAESGMTSDVARGTDGAPIVAVGGGHLVYMPAASDGALIEARVDRSDAVRYLSSDRKAFSQPRLSPDGKSVAVVEAVDGHRFSLQVYDTATGSRTTSTAMTTAAPPRWTADSRWVLFPEQAAGAWRLSWLSRDPREGAGSVLTASDSHDDGRGTTVVRMRTPGVEADWRLTAATGGSCASVVETAGARSAGPERPAIDASEVVLASDGRWLFFRQRSALVRREVIAGGRLGTPMTVLADGLVEGWCGNPNYDVSSDGSRVVAVYRETVARPSSLRYVLNFAAELRHP